MSSFILSSDQQQALNTFEQFLLDPTQKAYFLSGPAGSGKSHLVKLFIETIERVHKTQSLILPELLAPAIYTTGTTNDAVSSLKRYIDTYSSTIHSLLNLTVKNNYKTGKTYLTHQDTSSMLTFSERTIIFIDEATMISSDLYKFIKSACKHAKIVYIGDSYQLPPVEEEYSPILKSKLTQCELTTMHRFNENSSIDKIAKNLRNAIDTGTLAPLNNIESDVQFCTKEEFKIAIDKNFNKDMPMHQAKIVAWTNARVNEYNAYIRNQYSQSITPEPGEVLINNKAIECTYLNQKHHKMKLKVNDPITVNDVVNVTHLNVPSWYIRTLEGYKIYVAKNPAQIRALLKHYASHKDWVNFFKIKETFGDLRPRYASTVHKAQGSTYKNIYVDLEDINKIYDKNMFYRLLYVAITRAQEQVYIRGTFPTNFL